MSTEAAAQEPLPPWIEGSEQEARDSQTTQQRGTKTSPSLRLGLPTARTGPSPSGLTPRFGNWEGFKRHHYNLMEARPLKEPFGDNN